MKNLLTFKLFEMSFKKGELVNSLIYLKNKKNVDYKLSKDFETPEYDNEEIVFDLLIKNFENNTFTFESISNKTQFTRRFYLKLTDTKDNEIYINLTTEDKLTFGENSILKRYYIILEGAINEISVPAIPNQLRGLGFGKKIYKKIINVEGFISSNDSASGFAQNVWKSLIYDEDLICFFPYKTQILVLDKKRINDSIFIVYFLTILLKEMIIEDNQIFHKFDEEGYKLLKKYKSHFSKESEEYKKIDLILKSI